MKLQTTTLTLVTLLFPLSTFAAPTPDGVSVPMPIEESDTLEDRYTSPEAIGLVKRDVVCKILGSGNVNCRTGPGFKYPDSYIVTAGHRYNFDCYKSGDCYEGNCTWDRITWDGKTCYVNGHYTDSKCSANALGKC